MMISKLPGIVNPSEVYTEDVLKTIKDTLKQKSGEFGPKYDGSKAFTRNDESYLTDITDEGKYWREKFSRRKKNLGYGFFSDKAKPYQTLGKVYLESGDLILQSLTEDLRCKIPQIPVKSSVKWGKVARNKKSAPQQNCVVRDRTVEKLEPSEATAGFAAIKQRLHEIETMRKGIYASQSFSEVLSRKDNILNETSKKEDGGMRAPMKYQWHVVRDAGKMMGVGRNKDLPLPALVKTFRKKGGINRFLSASAELEELKDEEEKVLRWRQEKRKEYLINKLSAVNSLLCSIYNMRAKTLKSQVPLAAKVVTDLLRQDIALDQYGKPMSYRGIAFAEDAISMYSDGSNTPTGISEAGERHQKPYSAASNMVNNLEKKLMSSVALGTPRRPRHTQFTAKSTAKNSGEPALVKIETWEGLLAAGERNKKSSPSKPNAYSGKYPKGNARKGGTPSATGGSGEIIQPWCNIAQAEKAIEEKRKIMLSGNVCRKTAEDILYEIRQEFAKLQKKITKEVEDDLAKRKGQQMKMIQSKFSSIVLGPVATVALEKMRSAAYLLTMDRKDSSVQPMPWYGDLREEIRRETGLDDEKVKCIFEKIGRFKYEDGKNIPLAKEKLCLLVMSMPIHLLMNASMIHAILFVLAKVLEAAPELMDGWLAARKLTGIRQVETSATPAAINYLS